jgi:hypothetical protein
MWPEFLTKSLTKQAGRARTILRFFGSLGEASQPSGQHVEALAEFFGEGPPKEVVFPRGQ